MGADTSDDTIEPRQWYREEKERLNFTKGINSVLRSRARRAMSAIVRGCTSLREIAIRESQVRYSRAACMNAK